MRRDVKEDVKSVLIGAVEKAPSQGYGIEIVDKGDPEFRHGGVMIADNRQQTADNRQQTADNRPETADRKPDSRS